MSYDDVDFKYDALRHPSSTLCTEFQIIDPDHLKDIVRDDGIDLCIDCSGNSQAIESGLELMNPGGKICIYGVANPEERISVSPFQLFLKELSIIGTTINRFSYHYAISLMEAMGSRYMDFDKLGVKVYQLNQYEEALITLQKGLISKAVFKLDPNAQ